MTLGTLTKTIKCDYEAVYAPDSETALWGDYCEAMRQVTGKLPYDDGADLLDVDQSIANGWIGRYDDAVSWGQL